MNLNETMENLKAMIAIVFCGYVVIEGVKVVLL